MLDIKFVRNNPEVVKQNIKNKFQDRKLPLVDEVIELDLENRKIKQEVEALRADRNKLSKQIGGLMAKGEKEEAERVKAEVAKNSSRVDELTEKEKEVLFDFFPHLEMGDSSEWIWRTRISRFKYSQPKEVITPRKVNGEMFEVGDVVIVNDNYKHYAGEIQIVKIPIVNDGTRNRIGHLDEDEYQMMEFIYDGELVEFLEK